MEYLNGKGFIGDFAQRTLSNLHVIEQSDKTFEVTQLINSMLGLLVFPKERYVFISDTSNSVAFFKSYIVHGDKSMSAEELFRNMRNAISHSHILFEKSNFLDKDGKAQIGAVTFVNCKFIQKQGKSTSPCPKPPYCDKCRLDNKSTQKTDFQLTIPIKELRTCVEEFAKEIIAVSIPKAQNATK